MQINKSKLFEDTRKKKRDELVSPDIYFLTNKIKKQKLETTTSITLRNFAKVTSRIQ